MMDKTSTEFEDHCESQGEGINFSSLQKSPVHPLIYALSAKTADAEEPEARYFI